MRRTTFAAVAVAAAALTTACESSPMEQAYGLIDTFEATTTGNIEGYQKHRTDFEARYGDTDARCEPRFEIPDVPRDTWARYNMQVDTLWTMSTPEMRAHGACREVNRGVMRLEAAVVRRASMTAEDVAATANRLRGTVATFDTEQLGILLDNADSDEAAWATLMTSIGEDQLAERLTREQADARLERIWERLDEAMTTLEESEAKHRAVRDELSARVNAMIDGSWPVP